MKAKRFQPLILSLCTLWLSTSAFAEMRILNTQHYRIHSDLDPRLTEDLGARMDIMFDQYAARLSSFKPPTGRPFEVYLYAKKKDYLNLVTDSIPNSGGMFVPSRELLAAFLEGQGRDALRQTLQHEAFHQFAFMTIGPSMPIWLNEGLAQIFEEGIWTGRGFDIDQVAPTRLRQIQQEIRDRKVINFQKFVAISNDQWKRSMANQATGSSQYSQAWAMTHFLIFARDEDGAPLYRSRLISMLKYIHDKPAATDGFVKTFSNNYEGFQKLFLEYIRTLQPTRDATFIDRQTVLADILVQLSKQGKRYDDIEGFRNALMENGYRVRYTKAQVQWQSEADPAIYFRDEQGRQMNSQQLYFSPRGGSPLPDIICKPAEGLQLRTIFHDDPGRIDHETLIESK